MLGAEREIGRHHAVQHDGARVRRIAAQVFLRHARAVRNAEQVDLLHAERLAHRLEVGHAVARRVVARVGIELRQAVAREAREPFRAEVLRLAERVRAGLVATAQRVRIAGAALVDEDHVALAQHLAERALRGRIRLASALARAAGDHEHGIGLGLLRLARHPGDRELDPAAIGRGAVLRHFQRRASRIDGGGLQLGGERAGLELERAEARAFGLRRRGECRDHEQRKQHPDSHPRAPVGACAR